MDRVPRPGMTVFGETGRGWWVIQESSGKHQIGRTFVSEAAKAPAPSLTGGGAQAFKPTTDFKEASAQARERLRQAQSS